MNEWPRGNTDPWRERVARRIGVFVGVIVVAFVVTGTAVIAQRLSDEAIAVVAGAACGVGASIPTSLLIVWVAQRRQERAAPQQQAQGTYPPVVVVQQPPPPNSYPPRQADYLGPYLPASQREFNVVGGDLEGPRGERYQ
ncbi:MAG: hypothetical protein JW900_14480 [Anaerolineae bacterium]|nr:hypothetical protein [Anaerolineae bacterium]